MDAYTIHTRSDGGYLVKRYLLADGPPEGMHAATIRISGDLLDARAVIPGGLQKVTRHPGDEPSLVETWL